jgi:DNA polymerase-3 subunit epsilon
MRFLVFDTETTGLPQTKLIGPTTLELWPHIVQFSFIIYDDSINEIVLAKDYIINIPENVTISQESTNIHHITNDMCRELGLQIHIVLNEFFRHLRDADKLIGHNIEFDINMMRIELLRIINNVSNKNHITNHKINLHFLTNYNNISCTMKDSIEVCSIKSIDKKGNAYFKYPKLSELHEKLFNKSPSNLHNSFNDILITLRCFIKLKYNIDLMDNCESFKKYSSRVGIV